MEKLTGLDYIVKPFKEIATHPDFNVNAFQKMIIISDMSSDELEKLVVYRPVRKD